MISHRSPEMRELLQKIEAGLQSFLNTKRDFLLLTTSGSGGLEAAVVNTLSPGDRVLGVSAGAFGNRFRSIAEAYGAEVEHLDFEWGRPVEADRLRDALKKDQGYRAVLVTHNETSTGVTHPLEGVCRVIREESEALILVDAVSSLGGIALPLDDWGIDVVVTGSQKAWGAPPGVAMVGFSDRAWKASEKATMPRFYLDLARYRLSTGRKYPYTPAVSVFFALEKSLELILAEGAETVYQRHARVGTLTRQGIRSLGLSLVAEESFASNTVTAVWIPNGIGGKELVQTLRENYDTEVGGGQAHLAGRIFRIGHMGWVQEEEIDRALFALKKALSDLGHRV
jgi:aspartate aminotransferase-like enzyme